MPGETARIFNAAIGASAISAAFELGLFDAVKRDGHAHLDRFCQDHKLHEQSVGSIARVLRSYRILASGDSPNEVVPGEMFDDAFDDKGYFLWLVRGYGHLLQHLPAIIQEGKNTPGGINRDGKFIAMSGRDYGSRYVDPIFSPMLAEIPFEVAADLGCGSAERLIRLARARPGLRGVGVEVNKGAVELARASVAEAGLADRIQVVHADVATLTPRPEFADVQVMFCFFMGHDLWPRENAQRTLTAIREAFPKVERFLLCDTYNSELDDAPDIPIFTLGFEFTHDIMGQYIPTVAEWLSLFQDSGWHCAECRDVDIPYSTIFDLRRAPVTVGNAEARPVAQAEPGRS